MDIQTLLPILVPKAVAWAQQQSHSKRHRGSPLNEKGMALATRAGVAKPELVRIQYIPELPVLNDPLLRQVADATGLIGPNTAGFTLGYGIFIAERYASVRLISHEPRHAQQYERFGGIETFIPVYWGQIASVGYRDAALEQDARAFEVHDI